MRLLFVLGFCVSTVLAALTPDAIYDLSNSARDQLAIKNFEAADKLATQTRTEALAAMGQRGPDIDKDLALALGASIEVHAKVLAASGQREEAVVFLKREVVRWRTTSIRARIQKNLNLLTLEGKPAPPIDVTHWLGEKPVPLATLKGHPVLLFFWAHWCSDCKAEAPIIARLKAQYASRGLLVVAPTQHYGYAAQGADATPVQETQWIENVRQRYYAGMPVPVSEEAFKVYGVSTTPTIVLVDAAGVVRFYHPGAVNLNELAAQIDKITH